ncbi:MAG: sigma-54-dependent Fis family transcriptional regulator [Desulfobacteraceae bacterium]|nr:MAG: sigma-54-dependent Fis family transcriptional regulator [Desulfobacteraceae bacterium]
MKNKILVVDDESDFLESIRRGLITSGFKGIRTESDPHAAASALENGESFDVALIDITMPAMSGIELLEFFKKTHPSTECIMITALDEARTAVECLKKGAYDYLVKPVSKENLLSSINRALERKRLRDILSVDQKRSIPALSNPEAFAAIKTRNAHMLKILKVAELHAGSDSPVLITGETGTGKELLARAVHTASPRCDYPFTPINMDALSETLFDDQFFGHAKGAFTGADQDRAGFLESTHKGTLFLDEIGNLPLELQGRLLRVLQDGEFIKIGTNRPRKVDVRIIAATNKDLDRMMSKNQFRKDLFYRLSGGWVHLPHLRERKDDIPLLIDGFLKEFCGPGGAELEPETMGFLMAYDYPGNIRELKSIIKSAVSLAQGQPIHIACLPPQLQKTPHNPASARESSAALPTLAQLEKEHILKVYRMRNNNKAECARALDIGINTLRRKLAGYGVS